MTIARTMTALALTAALSPLLVACSDDAISAPPASAPTTAASSTSATPSASPDLRIAPPGETAREFIKRWFALINEAQRTGNVDGVLAVSGPECDTCQKFTRQVRGIYRDGGEIRGGIESIRSLTAESETEWVASLVATPSEFERRRGAPTERYSGGAHRSRLVIANVQGRWVIVFTESLQ